MNPSVPLSLESSALASILDGFFLKYPNALLRNQAHRALKVLLNRSTTLSGSPAGWIGGLVHLVLHEAIQEGGPVVLNSELEQHFGVSMSTIRKRARDIRVLCDAVPADTDEQRMTWRDEANALCACAFRNGPIEDIHASRDSDGRPRITDDEMRHLMINASRKLAELLELKVTAPVEYWRFIQEYNRRYCWNWERS